MSTLAQLISQYGGLIQTGPFGSQLHQKDYTQNGIPVVMPKDIREGKIDDSNIAHISENKAQQLSRHLLRPGSIVFPRRGEISKCAYFTDEYSKYLCGTGCLKIEVPECKLRSKFLFYFLGLPRTVEWLERNAVGTTMLNLNTQIIGKLEIPILDIKQQDSIIKILSAYDDLIENNRRRMRLLEESARLLYKEWFVHLRFPGHEHCKIVDGVPEGWEGKTLGDICYDVRKSVSPDKISFDTPYIGLEHMPRRSISLSEWGFAGDVNSTKLSFAEGDFLFCKIRPYFHKVGIAFVNGITSSDSIVIRPYEQSLYALTIMTVSSDLFIATTSQQVKEGSKMPRADWKQMKKFQVLIPKPDILSKFNEYTAPIFSQLRLLCFENKNLAAARDLLLPRLMSGEVAV